MKLSPLLCASVVALAALTTEGAFAQDTTYNTTKSNVKTNADATAPHTGSKAATAHKPTRKQRRATKWSRCCSSQVDPQHPESDTRNPQVPLPPKN